MESGSIDYAPPTSFPRAAGPESIDLTIDWARAQSLWSGLVDLSLSVPRAPEVGGAELVVGDPTSPLSGDDRESVGASAASARRAVVAGIADTAAEATKEHAEQKCREGGKPNGLTPDPCHAA